MDAPDDAPPLNPRQQKLLTQLRATGIERPTYAETISDELRGHIDVALSPHRPGRAEGEPPLRVDKGKLEAIHSCEARWDGDEWSGWAIPMVRGTLTDRAIRQLVMGRYRDEDDPGQIAMTALERLRADTTDQGRWEFLNHECAPDELAELLGDVTNHLSAFIRDWPRISTKWVPCMEERRRYDGLVGGDITLRGRFDLTLGTPAGTQARRAIIDLKTGGVQVGHASEARFYALLETLRQDVPPFQVGTYYLETGTLVLERITEDHLYQAADRLIDGVRKMWAIRAGREPVASPSGFCRYCSLVTGCPAGTEFVELRESA